MEELIKQQLVEKFLSIKESDHERYVELLKQLSDYYSAKCSFWIVLLVSILITITIIFLTGLSVVRDDSPSEKECALGVGLITISIALLPLVIICGGAADRYNSKAKVPEAAFLIEYKK